jgi:hypothetical protein
MEETVNKFRPTRYASHGRCLLTPVTALMVLATACAVPTPGETGDIAAMPECTTYIAAVESCFAGSASVAKLEERSQRLRATLLEQAIDGPTASRTNERCRRQRAELEASCK